MSVLVILEWFISSNTIITGLFLLLFTFGCLFKITGVLD